MPTPITIPRLGWNMEEGVFAGWLKADGDAVREGEPLFSLEGDKATQDIESLDPGILRIPPGSPGAGTKVLVGALIGYLLKPGEVLAVEAPAPAPAPPPVAEAVAPTATAGDTPVAAEVHSRRNGPRSTPLARRIARDMGVDWAKLLGTGAGGRIRKVDVLEAAGARKSEAPATVPARSQPHGQARRTIAARMVQSQRTTAPVTLNTTADATHLVGLRRQFKDAGPPGRAVPSFSDIIVKLVAIALKDHPHLHARWADDRLDFPDVAHVGIAVDTEAGLFVPVIRDPAGLGLSQVAALSGDLIKRAREQKLRPADMQGGTFTVTNLGSFGIDAFTPIINFPECAILGLGRIRRVPVMVGDACVGREELALSLTFDHRIVDGAPAARFLQHLVRLVENPAPWLIG